MCMCATNQVCKGYTFFISLVDVAITLEIQDNNFVLIRKSSGIEFKHTYTMGNKLKSLKIFLKISMDKNEIDWNVLLIDEKKS